MVGRNLPLTKCWSMRGSISLLFGPAESTAADFSQTLLKFSYVSQKVLIPPHAVAKCAVAVASSADFLSSHRRMRYRKKRQKSGQGGGREREEFGICVYCYLVCTAPPPFLSPVQHSTCLTRLRLWLSGQEVQQGGPPLLPTPLFSSQRPQWWISVTASIWRL